MPLIPYVDEQNAPEKVKKVLQGGREWMQKSFGELAQGNPPNSARLLAHRPEILEGFRAFTRSVLDGGVLDPVLKRLVALKTSLTNGCAY